MRKDHDLPDFDRINCFYIRNRYVEPLIEAGGIWNVFFGFTLAKLGRCGDAHVIVVILVFVTHACWSFQATASIPTVGHLYTLDEAERVEASH